MINSWKVFEGKIPTREEELIAIRNMKQGKNLNESFVILAPCVRMFARRMIVSQHKNYNEEDIIQIISMGILKAVERYDESFNVRFMTYAKDWILAAFDSDRRKRRKMFKYNVLFVNPVLKNQDEEESDFFNSVQDESMSQHEMLEEKEHTERFNQLLEHWFEEIYKVKVYKRYNVYKYDALLKPYFKGFRTIDQICDETKIKKEEMLDGIKNMLKAKREIDRSKYIIYNYILDDKTLEDIANVYHISRERVRQIADKLKTELMTWMKGNWDAKSNNTPVCFERDGKVYFSEPPNGNH